MSCRTFTPRVAWACCRLATHPWRSAHSSQPRCKSFDFSVPDLTACGRGMSTSYFKGVPASDLGICGGGDDVLFEPSRAAEADARARRECLMSAIPRRRAAPKITTTITETRTSAAVTPAARPVVRWCLRMPQLRPRAGRPRRAAEHLPGASASEKIASYPGVPSEMSLSAALSPLRPPLRGISPDQIARKATWRWHQA